MSSDNPFAEPDDPDRTIFIPKPGGTRAGPARYAAPPSRPAPPYEPAVAPTAAGPPPVGQMAVVQGPDEIATSGNKLIAAAAALLAVLGRMRNTLHPPDSGDLRERAAAELRRFGQAAREAGVAAEQVRPAHYALCAALDDVALSTPWGEQGAWAAASLVSSFHQQVRSGAEFFALLQHLSQSPATMLPVLELMYLCLALGFQGQYRLSPRGPAELDAVRAELYQLIMRYRRPAEPGLSPNWQGAAAPYRPRRAELPIWVAAACGLAALAGLYAWAVIGLGAASDEVVRQAFEAPPEHMPDIARGGPVTAPIQAEPGARDRLRIALRPEIDQGQVVIVGSEAAPVIRIRGSGMFAPGSATLEATLRPLLRHIGEALRTEPGPVTVAGYTDSQPIRTLRFPSNFQLSQARAEAAAAMIGEALGALPGGGAAPGLAARLTSEGRGEADPVDSNETPQGREQNRRIEVILGRPG